MVALYWVIVFISLVSVLSYYWIYHTEEEKKRKEYQRYEDMVERIRRGDY